MKPYNCSKILVVLASLVLCLGCSTDLSHGGYNGGNPDTTNSIDGGSMPKTDIVLKQCEMLVTVKGVSPDGKPASFYVFNNCGVWEEKDCIIPASAENVSEFELTFAISTGCNDVDPGSFGVHATRPNYLFADYRSPFIKVPPPTQTAYTLLPVAWTDGTWGLAPNGQYYDSYDYDKVQNHPKHAIKTEIASLDNKTMSVVIRDSGSPFSSEGVGIVTGDSFVVASTKSGFQGNISADLSVITYHSDDGFGNVHDGTLTLIK